MIGDSASSSSATTCAWSPSASLVGVSVVGLGVVHKLLAYLLIDVVNGLASAICMGPMRTIIQTETDEKMAGRVFGQARRNTSVDAARNAA